MKRNRFALCLVLITFGLIAVACGGNATAPTSAPAAPTASNPTAVSTVAPVVATNAAGPAATVPASGTPGSSAQGPKLNTNVSGTIDFWHFWGSQSRRTAIRRVINMCQTKLPNIKVNETFKPFGDI